MIEVRPLGLPGVFEITPKRVRDDRGFFSETYKAEALTAAGLELDFVQDNHARSVAAGVLRGLHYQLPPYAQDKLLRVARGRLLDVVVDVRKTSPSFGRWIGLEISADLWNQILIPAGYAHGYLTLEPETEVIYKVTAPYVPSHERSVRFDDPEIAIEWPLPKDQILLSAKDAAAPFLRHAEVFE